MFQTTLAAPSHRPAFGRRVVANPPRREGADAPRSMDAITAELRQRVLAARQSGWPPVARMLAR